LGIAPDPAHQVARYIDVNALLSRYLEHAHGRLAMLGYKKPKRQQVTHFSQPFGARPSVRGSSGAEVSILTLLGVGREDVPTRVSWGREDCGGALTPPFEEKSAIGFPLGEVRLA